MFNVRLAKLVAASLLVSATAAPRRAAPRASVPTIVDDGGPLALAPDAKLRDEVKAYEDKYRACALKAADLAYSQATRVDVNGQSTVVESTRTNALRDKAQAAVDAKCGTREKHDKGLEKFRARASASVEKSRVQLLASAKPSL